MERAKRMGLSRLGGGIVRWLYGSLAIEPPGWIPKTGQDLPPIVELGIDAGAIEGEVCGGFPDGLQSW
jgi:hypothetical protein